MVMLFMSEQILWLSSLRPGKTYYRRGTFRDRINIHSKYYHAEHNPLYRRPYTDMIQLRRLDHR